MEEKEEEILAALVTKKNKKLDCKIKEGKGREKEEEVRRERKEGKKKRKTGRERNGRGRRRSSIVVCFGDKGTKNWLRLEIRTPLLC